MFRSPAPALVALFALAVAPTGAAPAPVPVPPTRKVTPETELALLVGEWERVSVTVAGKEIQDAVGKKHIVTIGADGEWRHTSNGDVSGGVYSTERIDPTKEPKEMDLFGGSSCSVSEMKMIYTLDATTFTICLASKSVDKRPTAFTSTASDRRGLIVYKRVMKK